MHEIAALHDPAQALLTAADKAGADAADVLISYSEGLDLRNHQGEVDQVNSSQELEFGLRVLVGSRQALVSGSDLRRETLETMAEAAVARAKKVPENEWIGLPDPEPSLTDDLDLLDPNPPSQDWLVEQVNAMHDIVMGHDAISGTEGSSAGLYRQQMILANSKGFLAQEESSRVSLSIAALAGTGEARVLDYDYHSACHLEDLRSAEAIAQRAAERAAAKLGGRPVAGGAVPVIFSNRVAPGLIASLVAATNGRSIVQRTSFLTDKLGALLLPEAFSLLDQPDVPRGLASMAFDAEGQRPEALAIIEAGRLSRWLTDWSTARQLAVENSKRAQRSPASAPSPSQSNILVQGPSEPLADLIGDIQDGFYITEMMGQGLNPVTGDYSRGADGFWIRNGALAEPVQGMTVAGELLAMLATMRMADDAEPGRSIRCGALRIEGMRVAGV